MKKIMLLFALTLCLCACNKVIKHHRSLIQHSSFYTIDEHLIAGNRYGQFTLVEFFDYRCHACAKAYPAIEQLIKIDPQVRVIYRELPLLGPSSIYAAKAALASSFQGKYVAFHHALMMVGPDLTDKTVLKIAKKSGINITLLLKDMNTNFVDRQLIENQILADQLGVQGTPVYLLAKTTWHQRQLQVGPALLLEGAQTLKQLTSAIVDLNA